MTIPKLDVDAVARAIEADEAGEASEFPDLRQALTEAKDGIAGRVTTPEQMQMR